MVTTFLLFDTFFPQYCRYYLHCFLFFLGRKVKHYGKKLKLHIFIGFLPKKKGNNLQKISQVKIDLLEKWPLALYRVLFLRGYLWDSKNLNRMTQIQQNTYIPSFYLQSLLYTIPFSQFRVAAASVLERMNKRLRDDGVDVDLTRSTNPIESPSCQCIHMLHCQCLKNVQSVGHGIEWAIYSFSNFVRLPLYYY